MTHSLEGALTVRAQSSCCEPIAIIGIGCRFPGGINSPEQFWHVLRDGVDTIGKVPQCRWDARCEPYKELIPNYGGFIDEVDQFDASFFRISPKEAEMLDPQQRLLLEASWEAIEHAGINPDTLRGSDTGIFVGIFSNDYQLLQTQQEKTPHLYLSTGSAAATASGRVAYFLDLRGPAISIDTASSSSLVAFHHAIKSIQQGDCAMALASGVNLILSPEVSMAFTRAGMLSPDGQSKGFDAAANGYVRGEGCGVVLLKPLADAQRDGDRVMAVVQGSATNQDGASVGLTVPNGEAQEAVMRKALASAGLEADDVTYIEAHGSGTPVGDPIEGQALQSVYGTKHKRPWMVGSVKSNIGHLEAAAGIAGLIKATLALYHDYIPAHLHFSQLHPKLAGLDATIPTEGMSWQTNGSGPRRAGVSSFGFSGTNAHVILGEAPPPTSSPDHTSTRPSHLLTLSAKDEQGLRNLAQRYLGYLDANPESRLADLCHVANTGRAHFSHRLAAVAESTDELASQLASFYANEDSIGLVQGSTQMQNSKKSPKIAFLFTGGGAQYVDMGRELYETEPYFQQIINSCDQLLQPYLEQSLLEVLYPTDRTTSSPIHEMRYMQPVMFVIEYALAKLWQSWGIQPDVMMGHSLGEYVAACIAGVFSLADGLKLITKRGQLMQSTAQGEMVALKANEDDLRDIVAPLADEVSIGVINGPESIVISGTPQGVQAVLERVPHLKTTKLQITCASHSPLMKPVLAEFEEVLQQVQFSLPQIPVVSNVTGMVADESITSTDYWCRHLHETVRFAEGLTTLNEHHIDIFIEVGPKPVLLGIGRENHQHQTEREPRTLWLPSLRTDYSDWLCLQESLAKLYVRGLSVDWPAFGAAVEYQRIALPTYPFQRERFWAISKPQPAKTGRLEAPPTNGTGPHIAVSTTQKPMLQPLTTTVNGRTNLIDQLAQSPESEHRSLAIHFVQTEVRQVLGLRSQVANDQPLRELGLDSLMGTDLSSQFSQNLSVIIPTERLMQSNTNISTLADILLDKIAPLPLQSTMSMNGHHEAGHHEAGQSSLDDSTSANEAGQEENGDFNEVANDVPQIHAIVTAQEGRKLCVEGKDGSVYDFASCNYLGLDLHPEVMDAIMPAIRKWGVHPSWTRAVASPEIYDELEYELADLVGAPDVLVFPSITLLHAGVMPILAGYDGVILKDIAAHRSVYEGCLLAQATGATYLDFKHNDVIDLEEKLARYPYETTKIIAIDGVYSMSGAYPPLPEMAALAKKYNAWVYMDDAHGIGIIGENPTPDMPYGTRGNGIVKHFGLDYEQDRMIYVSGLSKSYSSFGAFITCFDQETKKRYKAASTFIFSGPSPVASLASAIAGLKLNRREGDEWRGQVYKLTYKLVTEAKAMGFEVINDNFFPIVGVVIGNTHDVVEACKMLWEYGILITPALYPIVPVDHGRLRFSITAANTEEEIDQSLEALQAVRKMLEQKTGL